MTLFSISFLFLFISWIHINLEAHVKTLNAKEDIKLIQQRIDLEEDVFALVRQGYLEGKVLAKANFEVENSILTINILGDSPLSLEYDIIGDGSFKWRKKYDSIK